MPKKKKRKNVKVAPVFHIFCEGEKTEPYYINGYINHYHSDKRNIVVVEETNKNTPVQLVDVAIKHRVNKNDVYWVVFDREGVSKYPHELHLNARKKAKKNNIKIAFSNVCFELWLLLHLEYSTASYSCCDNLIKQSNLKNHLKAKGIENYDKRLPYLFDKLKENLVTAFRNAERVNNAAQKTADPKKMAPFHLNPYTDIHELFIDIQNFIDECESIRDIPKSQRKAKIDEILLLL